MQKLSHAEFTPDPHGPNRSRTRQKSGGARSALEEPGAPGRGVRMADTNEPSVRRRQQTDGSGGDGDLPGDERPHVEVWRGGRDGHGAASRRERNAGRRVGGVGGEERREQLPVVSWASVFTTEPGREQAEKQPRIYTDHTDKTKAKVILISLRMCMEAERDQKRPD